MKGNDAISFVILKELFKRFKTMAMDSATRSSSLDTNKIVGAQILNKINDVIIEKG